MSVKYVNKFPMFFSRSLFMATKSVFTKDAPGAIGPYSQGVIANGFVFVSGQIPVVPETGNVISEDIREQTVR